VAPWNGGRLVVRDRHERRLCRGRLFRPTRDHRRTTLESGSPRNPPDALCDWRDVLPRECVGRVRDGLV
jgi:hypothetical protein